MADKITVESVKQYAEACAACQLKGQWVRNGNWLPIEHFFRHADCKAAPVSVVEETPSTILKVEPVKPEAAPAGKSVGTRPAFYLLVR
jgi:hypothetical protein